MITTIDLRSDAVVHEEQLFMRGLRAVSAGILASSAEIMGCSMHVTFLRVRTDEDGGQSSDGSLEAALHFSELLVMDPFGPFQTVKLDGYEGDWVMTILPSQQSDAV